MRITFVTENVVVGIKLVGRDAFGLIELFQVEKFALVSRIHSGEKISNACNRLDIEKAGKERPAFRVQTRNLLFRDRILGFEQILAR